VCVSSSVLTSYSRQLYETVADLLQWSDQILLDGQSATVDSQRATDIINSITCTVNVSSSKLVLSCCCYCRFLLLAMWMSVSVKNLD